jgi:competence protein ComGC
MAEITDEGKQKKNIMDRLPKLSRLSLLILFIGIFLIIIIPLILMQNTEKANQSDYRQQVQMLENIVANPATQVSALEEDIRRAETNLENLQNRFPEEINNTSAIDELVSLADLNNIYIVKLTSSLQDITVTKDKRKFVKPSLFCVLSVAGDSANIQKFLIELDKLPPCTINSVTISMALTESDADVAIINVQLLLRE